MRTTARGIVLPPGFAGGGAGATGFDAGALSSGLIPNRSPSAPKGL
jgi:hypothetical protein